MFDLKDPFINCSRKITETKIKTIPNISHICLHTRFHILLDAKIKILILKIIWKQFNSHTVYSVKKKSTKRNLKMHIRISSIF